MLFPVAAIAFLIAGPIVDGRKLDVNHATPVTMIFLIGFLNKDGWNIFSDISSMFAVLPRF